MDTHMRGRNEQSISPNSSLDIFSAIFFELSGLSVERHTLTVTVTSCGPDSIYWFDYLVYDAAVPASHTSAFPKISTPSASLKELMRINGVFPCKTTRI